MNSSALESRDHGLEITTLANTYLLYRPHTLHAAPPRRPEDRRLTVKIQSEDSDRIDEESWEVGDGLPLGLDERRVRVEDDVSQSVRQQRAGAQRADEVDQSHLVRVAASGQHQDHVAAEVMIAHRLTVLTTSQFIAQFSQWRNTHWTRLDNVRGLRGLGAPSLTLIFCIFF